MLSFRKSSPRRASIRENRPDTTEKWLLKARAEGQFASLWVALGFFCVTSLIVMMREDVVQWRPGQWAAYEIPARVEFKFKDTEALERKKQSRRDMEPRRYKESGDVWAEIETYLLSLPSRVAGSNLNELSEELRGALDNTTLAMLQDFNNDERRRAQWADAVKGFIADIRAQHLVILPFNERDADSGRFIVVPGLPPMQADATYTLDVSSSRAELLEKFNTLAQKNLFPLALQPKVARLTLSPTRLHPTHVLDEAETAQARNMAAGLVTESEAIVTYHPLMPLTDRGEINDKEYQLLRTENEAYVRSLAHATMPVGNKLMWSRTGLIFCVFLITMALAAYVTKFQPRIVRNHARAVAIAALLVLTLLLAQLAAIGSSPLFVFGVAPTILVAMILTIAYDQRFSIGLAGIHAVLVTLALNSSMSFMLILFTGAATSCFLLDDVRTRSKLIEVGGVAALAMMFACAASGLINYDPPRYLLINALYAGAAGLACGFVVLGILPFIEKTFRITTSMTLLELADTSHPLQRRLALEAPGTYQHSQRVATLAEECAEAIGANSLLCRVASYYHDVGKINKPDYFVENQVGGVNRHLNLDPNLSLLIIIGHVKDGIELAKEYNLPTSLFPFIQQHHGTTLVEYFYHRACTQHEQRSGGAGGSAGAGPAISETQYRYPGPKPKSREIALVMLADCVESATRAMAEPNPGRIESLVHDLAMKRLQDGQFDECDLTMRDLEAIERSLVKTLLGIYHGRIAYPSTAGVAASASSSTTASGTSSTQQPPAPAARNTA